jgi:hypothetical protein
MGSVIVAIFENMNPESVKANPTFLHYAVLKTTIHTHRFAEPINGCTSLRSTHCLAERTPPSSHVDF